MKDWIEKVTAHPVVAHGMAAMDRYNKRLGPQFAAGVTYFSVLSMVPILMFAFSMLGLTLTVLRPDLLDQIKETIDAELGTSSLAKSLRAVVDDAFSNWASVTLVALATAGYSGSNWVGNLKRAVRVMWADSFSDGALKGNFFVELAINLAIFVGLLATVGLSLGVASIGGGFSRQVIEWLGWSHLPGIGFVFQAVGLALSLVASWILIAFLFVVLPRATAAPKAWLTGTLIGAVSVTALQQIAGRLVGVFSRNPAIAVFGSTIVLMLVFNILATIILMSAAWVGTHDVWAAELARKRADNTSDLLEASRIDVDETRPAGAAGAPRRWAATRTLDDLRRAEPLPPLSTDPERGVRQDVAGRSVRIGATLGYGVGAATGLGLGAALATLVRRLVALRRR
ncbi:YhjD/YihY/BrkB family envelope integrity protein [Tessaracoccus sp. MC1679]|uniref:YhjD/YihY/BrkB family envelope integrity protein n=1 Tax=Tessaracoccus sp. MC1679 TaxID=2760313 RepID=UPI0015FFFC71|nr:YihY/virulence factor BrkB family protein [Tessaracoccus sp. MC1679]